MIYHGTNRFEWPSLRWPSALIHVRIFAAQYGKTA